MARLGFMTFGILQAPYGDPLVQGFMEATADVFEEAKRSDGYVCHALKPEPTKPSFGQVYGEFGEFIMPRFYKGGTQQGELTQAPPCLYGNGSKRCEGLPTAACTRGR